MNVRDKYSETLKSIYFSPIQSHIRLFGATTKSNLTKIFRLQKQALRIIFNLGWRDTIKSLFSELQIPTIFSLYTVSRIYESEI